MADNLAAGDGNGPFVTDVFVHDLFAGTTVRASVSSDGQGGNGASMFPTISSDGRFVGFRSGATNLVRGDRNGLWDTFVRDRDADRDGVFDEGGTETTLRIAVSSDGAEPNGESGPALFSTTGQYVAVGSGASNLVRGDTNSTWDVFVRDRDADGNGIFDEQNGVRTVRVSLSSEGREGNGASGPVGISSDGRFVAFVSGASDLVRGDTNSTWDVFVRDRDADDDGVYDEPGAVETSRVSVSSRGRQSNGPSWSASPASFSSDGRLIAFISDASNLVAADTNGAPDLFVRDRRNGETSRVSLAPDGRELEVGTYEGSLSGDGSTVAYLAPDQSILTRDLASGRTASVITAYDGSAVHGPSAWPSLSSDASYLAFFSRAPNLVPYDDNGSADIFVWGRMRCPDGRAPEGPVSGPVQRDVEPAAGWRAGFAGGGAAVRAVNCGVITPAGL